MNIFLCIGKNRLSIEKGKEFMMEKKIKFSDQPIKVKIIYASIIAVLCITAVVLAIASKKDDQTDIPFEQPSLNLPSADDEGKEQIKNEKPQEEEKEQVQDTLTFTSPIVGKITKGHSLDTPVFSDTLNEWRVHTGIDISAEEGAMVYSSADGVVSKIYSDPFLGQTVEITHKGGITSIYSNLDSSSISVNEGATVRAGAVIGKVGDTSISELADESHLHFAIKVNGVSVNPLDYISEDSKKHSLGITEV